MAELLFIIGFTIHNIEEALLLPEWYVNAGFFHKKVSEHGFRFAVVLITAFGYILTCLYLFTDDETGMIKSLYLGFVMMMVINAVFPHLAATVVIKKYTPGTFTGVIFNIPVGSYILYIGIYNRAELLYTIGSCILLSVIMILLIRICLKTK